MKRTPQPPTLNLEKYWLWTRARPESTVRDPGPESAVPLTNTHHRWGRDDEAFLVSRLKRL
jgi:hypothetical protein